VFGAEHNFGAEVTIRRESAWLVNIQMSKLWSPSSILTFLESWKMVYQISFIIIYKQKKKRKKVKTMPSS